jgi:hypothetical protein
MALIALYQWHETPALDFVIAGRAATAARVDLIGANISPEWGVNDLYPSRRRLRRLLQDEV